MTYSEWSKQFEPRKPWRITLFIKRWKPGKGPIDRLVRFLKTIIKGEKG